MEAAQVWNVCVQAHRRARMSHAHWPNQTDLQQLTRGRFALHSQSVQAVFRSFLGTIETTCKLRREHPEMRMKYPWRTKRFYPVHWPAQAVSVEQGRAVLPMGRGRPSLVLPLALPELEGACTLVWNYGFELHVCLEVPQADHSPGSVQAIVDLVEIHLAAATTSTGVALIVTGCGIRSLKRQRNRQLGQLAKKQSRCQKHSRRWKKLQRARNKVCRRAERRVRDPLEQSHQGRHRLLRREPGGNALRRQPAWSAHPRLRPAPQPTDVWLGIRPRYRLSRLQIHASTHLVLHRLRTRNQQPVSLVRAS